MKMKYLFLVIFAITMFSAQAGNFFKAGDLAGTWKYTVSNVPPEYETGTMVFEQKDDKWSGSLGSTERMEMKELAVDQGKITFKLDFQGGVLNVTLNQEGDSLKGTIVSQDGEFPITAVKEAKN
ncbi:hypothetical protein MUK70_06090 [Dyadobacter chenwenxiniae]|uniref:Lipocalin-like domain-containing protein n=1 Tax=Dyadobacter chenwenxiniae TaxID=2906456 RepID=A0A9X1TP40_9BACT|nr:hypothetical protein [Dyadobacter chenwenxiniae]MCF0050584.1 hypothetical protein [Dyadobacter chenwenxiniae]MCF0065173.1 hypothetical protein [Dyadobacter chenwenxiniae]UON84557.1 hypothetical protein MUK70_06090 [Dyadobacter chenwenxiniae]